jgi:hypothetical protein
LGLSWPHASTLNRIRPIRRASPTLCLSAALTSCGLRAGASGANRLPDDAGAGILLSGASSCRICQANADLCLSRTHGNLPTSTHHQTRAVA